MRCHGNIEFPRWALKYVYPEYPTVQGAEQRLAFEYAGSSAHIMLAGDVAGIVDELAVEGRLAIEAELVRLRIGYDAFGPEGARRVRYWQPVARPLDRDAGEDADDLLDDAVAEMEEAEWRRVMRSEHRLVHEPAYT